MTAMLAVPPPISIIILPTDLEIGSLAPMAAAIGSSMSSTSRAPAFLAASRAARVSTFVIPHGTPINTRGANKVLVSWRTLFMKYANISSVTSKSEITPSFSGRTTSMCDGVRPCMAWAASPIATSCPVFLFIATMVGSLITTPLPRT